MSSLPQVQVVTSTSGWELHGTAPADGSGALIWRDELELSGLGPTDVLATHNVAIACLPFGEIGNNASATVATRLTSTFPGIKFGLMVGIEGGVPPAVRLGDVVVSAPVDTYGGVVQWVFGKSEQGNGFRRVGSLDGPPTVLKTALVALRVRHEMEGSRIREILDAMEKKVAEISAQHVETKPDQQGKEEEEEEEQRSCSSCNSSKAIKRKSPRDTKIHYGLVASGNRVIKDGVLLDEINSRFGGKVLCFEMEAAGLMNDFRCLVISGICDYADSHKNKA
ncbi:nucleoside phosphorylase domain-containing protein [Aspergillus undulatus]|uniref:nucleoside phosphorylase domain-containing protein n=1 Tax=Aspergillus undulatus TaxID=1810928 RepID=UPI003CCE413E